MSDCVLWDGKTHRTGYGIKRLPGGKETGAHRWVWQQRNGEIPDDMFVLHHCDTRNCVNLDHLYLGTHEDNMRDMIERRRFRSKLSDDDVHQIRALSREGLANGQVAEQFGVTRTCVQKIVTGQSWAHLEDDLITQMRVAGWL